jgi:DNA-binding CsgD family transcriptional regulator
MNPHNLGLNPREVEIITRISAGMGDKGIAADLGASVHTIKAHVLLIFRALDIKTRAQAAYKWGRYVEWRDSQMTSQKSTPGTLTIDARRVRVSS